jgi:hypothetical protein
MKARGCFGLQKLLSNALFDIDCTAEQHAAGKIASNGPYAKVSDIYKISGLTDNDKKLFKKYEKELSCNPPGRVFNERINARVST